MIRDYIQLIRINNLLFLVIILGLMEKYVAAPLMAQYQQPEPLTWWAMLLLILAVVLIAAGGYVINDYFDVKIDAINRPDKLVITRTVTKDQAMRFFYILTGVGVACGIALAILLRSMVLGTIFVVVPGLLWFYSASYKRQFLVGNLIVAFLSGLTPLMVAFACNAVIQNDNWFGPDSQMGQLLTNNIYLWTGGFALFAFITTWAREIIKDIEDQEGDRELECHTFPVKYGNLVSKIVVTVLLVCTMGLMSWIIFAALPVHFAWSNFSSRFYLLMMVGFACEIAMLWNAKVTRDFHVAQQLMKFLMFLGTMFAFCVPGILSVH